MRLKAGAGESSCKQSLFAANTYGAIKDVQTKPRRNTVLQIAESEKA